jgi:hypothetical protein
VSSATRHSRDVVEELGYSPETIAVLASQKVTTVPDES